MTKSSRNNKKKKAKNSASSVEGRNRVKDEFRNGDVPSGEAPSVPSTMGALKKKQHWETKALKVKLDDLRKKKLKLSKREPQQKSSRKALDQQIKELIGQQRVTHQNELQELEAQKVAAESTLQEQQEAAQSTDLAIDHQEAGAVTDVQHGVDANMEIEGGKKNRAFRKSLAKRMKKSKAASKKRAWHLVAEDMGMIVNDTKSVVRKTKMHGLKVKKKTRVKFSMSPK